MRINKDEIITCTNAILASGYKLCGKGDKYIVLDSEDEFIYINKINSSNDDGKMKLRFSYLEQHFDLRNIIRNDKINKILK